MLCSGRQSERKEVLGRNDRIPHGGPDSDDYHRLGKELGAYLHPVRPVLQPWMGERTSDDTHIHIPGSSERRQVHTLQALLEQDLGDTGTYGSVLLHAALANALHRGNVPRNEGARPLIHHNG